MMVKYIIYKIIRREGSDNCKEFVIFRGEKKRWRKFILR